MCIVSTTKGQVEGFLTGNGQVEAYLGIPYALPPVGELRWQAPHPIEAWEGLKDCTHFSNVAVQAKQPEERLAFMPYTSEYFITDENTISEDCLYLNVWKPAGQTRDAPVLVIIHGGAFSAGMGSVPYMNGERLAGRGVVVVTINCRLGIFGFLAHPQLSATSGSGTSGNYGILDQIAALKWIQENIRAFGGNPDCVTISGESAGAMSVGILYESPLAKGLFHRAAAESGSELVFTGVRQDLKIAGSSLREAEHQGEEFMKRMGCGTIDELRRKDTMELFRAGFTPWPVRDGYVWPKDGMAHVRNWLHNDVPLLIGSNADEGTAFAVILPKSMAEFEEIAAIRYGEKATEMEKLYPMNDVDQEMTTNLILAEHRDRGWGFAMYNWAKQQSNYGTASAYLYYYSHWTPGNPYRAFHTSELCYLYDNLDQMKSVPWEEEDRILSSAMSQQLLNFVHTGDPNGGNLPVWKRFADAPEQVMKWDMDMGMIDHPQLEAMKFYESMFIGDEKSDFA